MKVYYNGFNLYKQFPSAENLVEIPVPYVYENLVNIEVSYHYVVLLVADTIVIQGARTERFSIKEQILQISCNEDKILVLLTNGDLLKITKTLEKVPKFLNFESDDKIIKVSCGSKLLVALTEQGKLYTIPNKLNFENKDIIDIKTGREHCLLLDKNGNVYSFGRGSRGQLGHGCLDDEFEPRFLEALGGILIVAVEVGGWHSCALSKDGDLYVWGWNGNGQLGLFNNVVSVVATPQVVDVDFNIKIVGCGNKHTVVLSDNGILYGCGWNKYKQLKKDDQEIFYRMTRLGDFSKEKNVKDVKCGPWNTLLLCEE